MLNNNKPTEFLRLLPLDLLEHRILHDYCDGQSLSSLVIALTLFENHSANTSDTCPVKSGVQNENGDDDIQNCTNRRTTTNRNDSSSSSKRFYISLAMKCIPDVGSCRLEQIANRMERQTTTPTSTSYASDAIEWIRSLSCIQNVMIEGEDNEDNFETNNEYSALLNQKICEISNVMKVLDYLEDSIMQYSNPSMGQFEWPVWYGTIAVEYVDYDNNRCSTNTNTPSMPVRCHHTARVVITSPIMERLHPNLTTVPGSEIILNSNDNETPTPARFTCESNNMVPVQPWGKIHGLSAKDEDVLQYHIGRRLIRTNEIAIPCNYYNAYGARRFDNNSMLNIRVLTQLQAEQRRYYSRNGYNDNINNGIRRRWIPPPCPTDWIINGDNNCNYLTESDAGGLDKTNRKFRTDSSLICTWETKDDHDVPSSMRQGQDDNISSSNNNDIVTFITRLLQAKAQLLNA